MQRAATLPNDTKDTQMYSHTSNSDKGAGWYGAGWYGAGWYGWSWD